MHVENLKEGDYITLTRGVKLNFRPGFQSPYMGAYTAIASEQQYDRSWVGSVLRVLVVDLPFVVVEELAPKVGSTPHTHPISINLSEVRWKPLTAEYVRVMTEKK